MHVTLTAFSEVGNLAIFWGRQNVANLHKFGMTTDEDEEEVIQKSPCEIWRIREGGKLNSIVISDDEYL